MMRACATTDSWPDEIWWAEQLANELNREENDDDG